MNEKCGTYAGWNIHKVAKEPPCEACKRAQNFYMRAWRRRGLCVPGLGWPLGPGDIAPARPRKVGRKMPAERLAPRPQKITEEDRRW